MTPTQRTLKALREQGRVPWIVERRVPPRPGAPYGITIDLFHIIDIIALDPRGSSVFSPPAKTSPATGGR